MSASTPETDFQHNALALFKQLKERIRQLEVSDTIVNELTTLVRDGEALVGKSNAADAEKKYDDALAKLNVIDLSFRSTSLAHRLFGIEVVYLLLLLILGYGTYKWPHFGLWYGVVNLHLQTAWFGALGGVTIAIYGIYDHVQKRDFDPSFELWYLCKPVIGAIFGWFVYLIYLVGFVSVQGLNSDSIKKPEVPFVIAFLAGFSERFTLKMIDKLMSVLTTFQDPAGRGGASAKDIKP